VPDTLNRRDFIYGTVGLNFCLTLPLTGCIYGARESEDSSFVTAWVNIEPGGGIVIQTPAAEMGQGSMTALPIIFAEELDADWDDVNIVFSPADDSLYANPLSWIHGIMLTLGSASVAGYFDQLRLYGAQARRVLLESTAERLNVPLEELSTEPSSVVHMATGRRLSYGEIASFTEYPDEAPRVTSKDLKHPSQFRLIGHDLPRRDIPAKVDGTAEFSIDKRLPDMLYATVTRSPVKGALPIDVDASGLQSIPDLVEVVTLPDSVAVVANNYTAALSGERAISIRWSDVGEAADFDSDLSVESHVQIARDLTSTGQAIQSTGDTDHHFDEPSKVYEASFSSEMVYHAHLEPLNSVSWVMGDGTVEIWAGTQAPTHLVRSVAEALNINTDKIVLHRSLLGGAFGRRGAQDHDWVVDSALLSQKLKRPIKAIWSRQADLQFGRFKPITGHYLRAAEDANGRLTSWHHRLASDEAIEQSDPYRYEKTNKWPVIATVGLSSPYAIPNIKTEFLRTHTGMRISPLRGVGATANMFASESFMDEIANIKGVDPIEFRLDLLEGSSAARDVVQAAADMSEWHRRRSTAPLGFAYAELDGTLFATVAQISPDSKPENIQVKRVWAVVDAGIPVQPNNIAAQFEGAIIFALSNILKERITIKNGAVQQSNFHDYSILRMQDAPIIQTRIMRNTRKPTGIGDTVGVSVAPAVANAYRALAGRRLTALPFGVN
jgi:isoquinoline 1-oxidoreductase beta subunit